MFAMSVCVHVVFAEDIMCNALISDKTPPVFTGCPANISVELAPLESDVRVDWVAPTASDYMDNAEIPILSMVTIPAGLNSGDRFSRGVTVVTYSAEDTSSNVAQCRFWVEVQDVTAPVNVSSCLQNLRLNASRRESGVVVTWPQMEDAVDAVDGVIPWTDSPTTYPIANLFNGSIFPIGTTSVMYTATDASGNAAVCTFTVKIIGAFEFDRASFQSLARRCVPPVLPAPSCSNSLTYLLHFPSSAQIVSPPGSNHVHPALWYRSIQTRKLYSGGTL